MYLTLHEFCSGNQLSETVAGSAPSQLVHINMTVILVSVTAVACKAIEHSGGPTVQYSKMYNRSQGSVLNNSKYACTFIAQE